jgi:hypothetical protein
LTQATAIPEDVTNTPAGPDGNGFLALGVQFESLLGSDDNFYVRENGVISLASETDDDLEET